MTTVFPTTSIENDQRLACAIRNHLRTLREMIEVAQSAGLKVSVPEDVNVYLSLGMDPGSWEAWEVSRVYVASE